MTNTARAEWLNGYIKELERAANQEDGRLYEAPDGTPHSAAGFGTLGVHGFYLATNLAAVSDDQQQVLNAVYEHRVMALEKLGEHAWEDVLYAAIVNLAQLYLEPAYLVADTTNVDVRSAARVMWEAFEEAVEKGGGPAE